MTTIQALIAEAKEQGFTVYAPENLTSYFYFTRDNKIGYCQLDRIGGVSFSTVHKANRTCGTGYRVESFDEALENRPSWASPSDPVVKFSSIDEFLGKHWQPLVAF